MRRYKIHKLVEDEEDEMFPWTIDIYEFDRWQGGCSYTSFEAARLAYLNGLERKKG